MKVVPWLRERLACAVCHGALIVDDDYCKCLECGYLYPQSGSQRLDMLPLNVFTAADSTQWQTRHRFFVTWLKQESMGGALRGDREYFEGTVGRLGHFPGYTLDVGGGDGFASLFMQGSNGYVTVDPEHYPLSRVPCEVPAIRGVAEYLPFVSASFDHVFCLAVLNHTSRPPAALAEMIRVLRPGGMLLLGFEDEHPWLECLMHGEIRAFLRATAEAMATLRSRVLQPDHVAVPRDQVRKSLEATLSRERTVFLTSRGVLEIVELWRKPSG